jgi:hypothetical protein
MVWLATSSHGSRVREAIDGTLALVRTRRGVLARWAGALVGMGLTRPT